jgi:hypothetical protein
MDTVNTFWTVVGKIESVIFAAGIIYAAFLWIRGISPAILRLGNGLAKREIAIFAKGENSLSLKNLLLDSKLFKAKNIRVIGTPKDIGSAESATMLLVYWHDWATEIDSILEIKADASALIVYAPYDHQRIPENEMKKLDGKRHTAVTNFRGRLLNDIVASMITTAYEKS